MGTKLERCQNCDRTIVDRGLGPNGVLGFWVKCRCMVGPFRTNRAEAIRLWNTRKGE